MSVTAAQRDPPGMPLLMIDLDNTLVDRDLKERAAV